jgi:hypothetical protein
MIIIITGTLTVDQAARDAFLESDAEVVEAARSA